LKKGAGSTSLQEVVRNIVSRSPEQTQRLGMQVGELSQPGDLFLLVGGLGTGKTCLTQGIAWGLGVEGYATSPSFVVINQHRGRLPLYHIDLYRIESIEEVIELGLDDYLYGGGVCVVEWAEKAFAVLPAEHLLIEMSFVSDTSRSLTFKARGQRYLEMLSQLSSRQRAKKALRADERTA